MQNSINLDRKNMWKDAGILFAITLIAGLLLGFVYELTKQPIQEKKAEEVQEACKTVFADAVKFSELEDTISPALIEELKAEGVTIGTIYAAKDTEDNQIGYVIQAVSSEGYGGSITLYAGIAFDGTLKGVSILDISETPGLGMRAEEVLVPQFSEKKVEIFTYTKNGSQSDSEIDAISGATITTHAVTNAVNGALRAAEEISKGGNSNE